MFSVPKVFDPLFQGNNASESSPSCCSRGVIGQTYSTQNFCPNMEPSLYLGIFRITRLNKIKIYSAKKLLSKYGLEHGLLSWGLLRITKCSTYQTISSLEKLLSEYESSVYLGNIPKIVRWPMFQSSSFARMILSMVKTTDKTDMDCQYRNVKQRI